MSIAAPKLTKMDSKRKQVSELLQSSGDKSNVVNEVLPLVYDEMRRLASHFLKGERADHTLMTTELVHEAYLRLFGIERMAFADHRHFFRTAAVAMRRILVDHERQRRAQKRIPPAAKIPIELGVEPPVDSQMDLLRFDDVLDELAKLHARQARIVELRYFGGLTEEQVAEVLEISRRTVTREMRAAKLWLRDQMQG